MLFNNNDNPDILDLLSKVQEATTSDVDEERGSFKKGDKVTYNMLGGGLTDSDLVRTLGANEHAIRTQHDNIVAAIVEAMGEAVSRYSIQFNDGFVINDVAASELTAIAETEEDKSGHFEKEKCPDCGKKVLTAFGEDALEKHMDAEEEMGGFTFTPDRARYTKDTCTCESKVDEAEEATQTMKPQEKPDLSAEDLHMEDYSDEDLNKPVGAPKSKSEESGDAIRGVEDKELEQSEDEVVKPKNESKVDEGRQEYIDKCVKVFKAPGGTVQQKIAYMKTKGATDSEITQALDTASGGEVVKSALGVESKTEEAVEVKDIPKAKIVAAYKKYRGKGKSREEAVQRTKKDFEGATAPEIRNILGNEGVKESNFSFLKKQEPLWLCNECFKTFRSDGCTCTLCESTNTENLLEGYGDLAGSTKEVFKVTWADEETGDEKSTKLMAFDEDDAKREVERNPKKKVVKVEGPITSAEKGQEAPFEQVSEGSEVTEGVGELVGETSGIDIEDQKILNWALEDGAIPMAWPSEEDMIDQLSMLGDLANTSDDYRSAEDLRPIYLKHVLLPKATKAYGKSVSESEWSDEMEQEGIPVAGRTYRVRSTVGKGWSDGNYLVTEVEYSHTARGDLGKYFKVEGNDNWWLAKLYHFDEVDKANEAKRKEVKPFVTIEIVHSTVDPDMYNIRAVELPRGSIVLLDTKPNSKAAIARGKELAGQLNAKFLGIVDEAKRHDRMAGGMGDKKVASDFSPQQVKWGVEIEMEHTDDPDVAREIAIDHLTEDPEYYTKLRNMEAGACGTKEAKLKEQEEDSFITIGKGLSKEDAEKLAHEKDGQVIVDEEDDQKFAVITKGE